MRDRVLTTAILAAALLSSMAAPAESHQTGPGERKSPARGTRLDMEPTPETTSKKQSASLKRLLRK